MNKRKGRKHPKEVIIEYFDTLINKVDIYVEELHEIYNDDETLKTSETSSKKIDGKKRVMPKLKIDFEDNAKEEKEENDIDDEIDDSEDNSEGSTDSDSDDNEEDDDKSIEYSESEEENEEKNEEEEEKSDDDDEEDEDTKSEDLQLVYADESMNIDSSEIEEGIEENSFDYSESDYSGYKDDEQIDGEREYMEKIYGIEEITDPYRFDTTFDKRLSFNAGKKESIKTSDYLNKVRSFLIDEIRKVEKESIESYESNKTEFKFKNNSSIEEMKKALFKNRFCFLLDTQADQKTEVRYLKSDRKRVFNLCLIITDFYLSNAQLNLIRLKTFNQKFYM